MPRQTQLIILAVIVVMVCIVLPLIPGMIRRKDFRDQINGKKPERKAGPNVKYSDAPPQHENSQITIDREILRTKAGQNLLGPH